MHKHRLKHTSRTTQCPSFVYNSTFYAIPPIGFVHVCQPMIPSANRELIVPVCSRGLLHVHPHRCYVAVRTIHQLYDRQLGGHISVKAINEASPRLGYDFPYPKLPYSAVPARAQPHTPHTNSSSKLFCSSPAPNLRSRTTPGGGIPSHPQTGAQVTTKSANILSL